MDHGDGDEEEEEVEAVRVEQQQHPVLHASRYKHAQSSGMRRRRSWTHNRLCRECCRKSLNSSEVGGAGVKARAQLEGDGNNAQ